MGQFDMKLKVYKGDLDNSVCVMSHMYMYMHNCALSQVQCTRNSFTGVHERSEMYPI